MGTGRPAGVAGDGTSAGGAVGAEVDGAGAICAAAGPAVVVGAASCDEQPQRAINTPDANQERERTRASLRPPVGGRRSNSQQAPRQRARRGDATAFGVQIGRGDDVAAPFACPVAGPCRSCPVRRPIWIQTSGVGRRRAGRRSLGGARRRPATSPGQTAGRRGPAAGRRGRVIAARAGRRSTPIPRHAWCRSWCLRCARAASRPRANRSHAAESRAQDSRRRPARHRPRPP